MLNKGYTTSTRIIFFISLISLVILFVFYVNIEYKPRSAYDRAVFNVFKRHKIRSNKMIAEMKISEKKSKDIDYKRNETTKQINYHITYNNLTLKTHRELRKKTKRLTKEEIFIAVKTSGKYVRRLDVIIDTWFTTSSDKIYFFTDQNEKKRNISAKGHIINTFCPSDYKLESLCCKMSQELQSFLLFKEQNKWFCHFDDDNYVNVNRLVDMLSDFDHRRMFYVGRRINSIMGEHATGGAGFCLSRVLIIRMLNRIGRNMFLTKCLHYKSPDDVTVARIIKNEFDVNVTNIIKMHSHLEHLSLLPSEDLIEQVSLSYSDDNKIKINGFATTIDSTRFYSLHCLLHNSECFRLEEIIKKEDIS